MRHFYFSTDFRLYIVCFLFFTLLLLVCLFFNKPDYFSDPGSAHPHFSRMYIPIWFPFLQKGSIENINLKELKLSLLSQWYIHLMWRIQFLLKLFKIKSKKMEKMISNGISYIFQNCLILKWTELTMCLLSFLQLHLALLSKQTFCVIVNYLHLKWIYLSFSKTIERFLLPHLCSSYTPHSSCSTFFQNPLYLPHFYFHIYARSMLCPERPIF